MSSRTGKVKQQAVWWIAYSKNGVKHRESSGSRKHTEAVNLLNQRLSKRGHRPSLRDQEKVTFEDLAGLIRADYKNQGNRSLDRLERSLRHLSAAFSDWRAVDIGDDVVERYKADRRDAGAAKATVNRELAALRRMFRLGKKRKLVETAPDIDLFSEKDNVRRGFVEEPQHQALLEELPWHHAAWAEAAYITGWRDHKELLTRRWEHVDFEAGWIRVEPTEAKTDHGKQFPLTPRLRKLLERQYERKQQIERERGIVIPWVFFQPNGKPIRYIYSAWRAACVRAGLGRWVGPGARTGYKGSIPHDYRRTAVRNLNRAGVARSTAMAMVGLETASIYKRYSIEDEKSLQEGGERLQWLHDSTPKKPERKVRRL